MDLNNYITNKLRVGVTHTVRDEIKRVLVKALTPAHKGTEIQIPEELTNSVVDGALETLLSTLTITKVSREDFDYFLNDVVEKKQVDILEKTLREHPEIPVAIIDKLIIKTCNTDDDETAVLKLLLRYKACDKPWNYYRFSKRTQMGMSPLYETLALKHQFAKAEMIGRACMQEGLDHHGRGVSLLSKLWENVEAFQFTMKLLASNGQKIVGGMNDMADNFLFSCMLLQRQCQGIVEPQSRLQHQLYKNRVYNNHCINMEAVLAKNRGGLFTKPLPDSELKKQIATHLNVILDIFLQNYRLFAVKDLLDVVMFFGDIEKTRFLLPKIREIYMYWQNIYTRLEIGYMSFFTAEDALEILQHPNLQYALNVLITKHTKKDLIAAFPGTPVQEFLEQRFPNLV